MVPCYYMHFHIKILYQCVLPAMHACEHSHVQVRLTHAVIEDDFQVHGLGSIIRLPTVGHTVIQLLQPAFSFCGDAFG
jgi:hypothetical protein